jgi:hypothetical protein
VLTYRTGAIGSPSNGAAMAEHLLEQTLSNAAADLARYYTDSLHPAEPQTSVAEPRRDMDPRIARLLGIDPNRAVTQDQLANLLNGHRADGARIEGKTYRRQDAAKPQIAFVDCCFSADKSVSLGWAFAPTEAERNIYLTCHRNAVDSTMAHIADELGFARRGAQGKGGLEKGELAWVKVAPQQQVQVLKGAAQATRMAKTDDLSDFQDWQRQARDLGWQHRCTLRSNELKVELGEQERLEVARSVMLELFDEDVQKRAVVTGADARVASARSLIASGIDTADDVNKLTHSMRSRGITQDGEETTLLWSVQGVDGRKQTLLTTALHEAQESELIGLARAAHADNTAALSPKAIAAAVEQHGHLDFTSSPPARAQREALERLAALIHRRAGIRWRM